MKYQKPLISHEAPDLRHLVWLRASWFSDLLHA